VVADSPIPPLPEPDPDKGPPLPDDPLPVPVPNPGEPEAPIVTCDNNPAPILSSMLRCRLVDYARSQQLL
jgi:hypothetical protein